MCAAAGALLRRDSLNSLGLSQPGGVIDRTQYTIVQMPGFVAFISAKDVPKRGRDKVFGDLLFATDTADYAGQRIGLVVATSQARLHQRRQLLSRHLLPNISNVRQTAF